MKFAPLVAVCLTMASHTIMALPTPAHAKTNASVSARAETATTRPICVSVYDECPEGTTKTWSLWTCRVWDVLTDHHWKGNLYHCDGVPKDSNERLQ